MVLLTPELLRRAIGCSASLAERYAAPLSDACRVYGIDTPVRLAAFLAQIGHESGSLRYVREIWGPTPAQLRYEGRTDLGNTEPGDGSRYRGHGLIQTTGRGNHRAVTARLRARGIDYCPDFEAEPERLEEPCWAALSAADYWDWRGLNALADAGRFELITRRINGGLNGQADRLVRWERARQALAQESLQPAPISQPAAQPLLQWASRAPETRPVESPLVEGRTMLPILAAAAPSLLSTLAGTLIDAFSAPAKEALAQATGHAEVANAIVDGVVDVARAATGAADPIDAVAAARKDPQIMLAIERAAIERMNALLPLVDKLAELEDRARAADERSREAAAARVQALGADDSFLRIGGWLRMSFVQALSLLLVWVSASGALALALSGMLDPQLMGAIVTLMLIAGYTGVREFWLGSSHSSQAKDAIVTQLSESRRLG